MGNSTTTTKFKCKDDVEDLDKNLAQSSVPSIQYEVQNPVSFISKLKTRFKNKSNTRNLTRASESHNYSSDDSIQKLSDLTLWSCGLPSHSGKQPSESETHDKKTPLAKTRWVHISNARLIAYEPAENLKRNGIALLIIAGGGYNAIVEREASISAKHFASQGFHTFELIYRLPNSDETGCRIAPFQDCKRAIKFIRHYGLQNSLFDKVGGIGFSAGMYVFDFNYSTCIYFHL